MRVVCRNDEHRVPAEDTFTARRFGGGNYRRPGRFYSSTICVDCAQDLLADARGYAGELLDRWDRRSLESGLRSWHERGRRPK